MKYLQRLITAFPSLLCDPPFVVALLEVLTLMHRACEGEFTDEVSANVIILRNAANSLSQSLRLNMTITLKGLI